MTLDSNTHNGIVIQPERADSADAVALIDELEAYLIPLSPPESRHGYSIDKLIAQGVSFFIARKDGVAVGCGGVQFFDEGYAELKRIYVRPAFRGLGLAKRLIARLEEHAHTHNILLMRLETGVAQVEAHGLYERMGYNLTGPFGEYHLDPYSRYYEKRL